MIQKSSVLMRLPYLTRTLFRFLHKNGCPRYADLALCQEHIGKNNKMIICI